ncbi:MAG: zinc-ribbon domain-containing protein [Prevotellaceae bacterium]|jgi:ribosomal protein L40E|nr:zinc-ribbon domain-containing protein [Prevotellaceae bacterium]
MENTVVSCKKCGMQNTADAKFCNNCGYKFNNGKKSFDKNKIAIVIAFFITSLIVKLLFFNTPAINKELLRMSNEMNKMCPVMIDRDTRLDNTITMPNNVFQYNYTLINMNKDDIDTLALKNIAEPNIVNSLKNSPDMQYQRDHDVTLNYSYKDKNGFYLFMISISADRYK